jgi:hypothetical protein
MNISELRPALARIGIAERDVALGGRADYSWCVEQSADGMWEVFWYERGSQNDLHRIAGESEACFLLLGRLTYSQLLAGNIAEVSAPNLPATVTERPETPNKP